LCGENIFTGRHLKMRAVIRKIAILIYKRIGRITPRSVRNFGYRLLYASGTDKKTIMYCDVVGTCNLRCPACPVGNTGPIAGLRPINPELFTRIVQKAKKDYGVFFIGLYHWAEPLLHPQLPDLIRIVKKEGLLCGISSNLNITCNYEAILDADPDDFRVSLSGFTQEVYGQTHVRGDIEKVKQNMQLLSAAKRQLRGNKTLIHVYFHKYRHNLHEIAPMRKFASSLGFGWLENWAYFIPLERVFELVDGTLPKEQQQFVNTQFALPIAKAIETAKDFKHNVCAAIKDQLYLDSKGDVTLCCATYATAENRLGTFLDMTKEEVSRAKTNHPICVRCRALGLHAYFAYHDNPALLKKYDILAKTALQESITNAPRRSA